VEVISNQRIYLIHHVNEYVISIYLMFHSIILGVIFYHLF